MLFGFRTKSLNRNKIFIKVIVIKYCTLLRYKVYYTKTTFIYKKSYKLYEKPFKVRFSSFIRVVLVYRDIPKPSQTLKKYNKINLSHFLIDPKKFFEMNNNIKN